ncbi:hypothetical protein BDV32DRAFT_155784 [Aspergillus pseudonomiae]|nr:hypothetical protein BDV32DRAFT_155784 [Aspergillus pseudonomiae]
MFTLSLHSPWAVTENMNHFAFLDSGKIVVEIVNLEWREPLPRCQWLRKLPNFFQDGPMGLVIRIALPIRQAVRSSSSDAQLHRTNTAIVRVQHPYLRLKEVYAWPFFQLLIGITVKDKKVSFGEIAEFTGLWTKVPDSKGQRGDGVQPPASVHVPDSRSLLNTGSKLSSTVPAAAG